MRLSDVLRGLFWLSLAAEVVGIGLALAATNMALGGEVLVMVPFGIGMLGSVVGLLTRPRRAPVISLSAHGVLFVLALVGFRVAQDREGHLSREWRAEKDQSRAQELHWSEFKKLLSEGQHEPARTFFAAHEDLQTRTIEELSRAFCSDSEHPFDRKLLDMMKDRGDATDGDLLGGAAICSRKVLESVLRSGVSPTALSSDGRNALMIGRDTSALSLLLDRGVGVNARSEGGTTALMLHRTPEVTSFLLAHGADPKMVDDVGRTPLHYGMPDSCVPDCVVQLVAAGVDPNQRDGTPLKRTPLHQLASREPIARDVPHAWSQGLADALVAAGADPLRTDSEGRTPLESLMGSSTQLAPCLAWPSLRLSGVGGAQLLVAATRGSYPAVITLLLDKGANPNAVNLMGTSALEVYHRETPPELRRGTGAYVRLEEVARVLGMPDAGG